MAVGSRMSLPPGQGRDLAAGDQRAMGRRAYAPRAGIGLMGVQDDQQGQMLKYLADVGRGVDPQPRTRGFGGVRRR